MLYLLVILGYLHVYLLVIMWYVCAYICIYIAVVCLVCCGVGVGGGGWGGGTHANKLSPQVALAANYYTKDLFLQSCYSITENNTIRSGVVG